MVSPLRLHADERVERRANRLDPQTVEVPTRTAPVREAPLPTSGKYPPLFAVMGAHGGAGTSTLARWWAPAADTGSAWPASTATTQRVIVAARMCIPGLAAAAERLREWHAGLAPDGVTVIGLALTAARPGKVPVAVRRYRSVIAELVDVVYEIGWHDELVVTELVDLAQFTPFDPAPARRRVRLREAVPADVHSAGHQIITRLAADRGPVAAQQNSETTS
ncbi:MULTISPECIES: hypothetical protein [Nocardia]|uniref:hypothetical protein n=1 Tax=Nocardia TaxID=1817 RepID=UPI000D69685D|nr:MULTISPECIES: hypothetical protein [Nocardia]